MEEITVEDLITKLAPDRSLRGDSLNWANWMSQLMPNTCRPCVEQHGKIVDISVLDNKTAVDAHPNCKCVYVSMRTKLVGTATDWGMEGADAYIFYHGHLPDYYVNKQTAYDAGWKSTKKKLSSLFPGKMLGGDEFGNNAAKLPTAPGKVWYEADINYAGGKRNRQRVLYSNDGLMFATYDHYHTFYEITSEGVYNE